jgi:hypothetical protein
VGRADDHAVEGLVVEELPEVFGGEGEAEAGADVLELRRAQAADAGQGHVVPLLEDRKVVLDDPPAGADHSDASLGRLSGHVSPPGTRVCLTSVFHI